MNRIEKIDLESPIVLFFTDNVAVGTGCACTIGTGGSSIVAMIRDHLAPKIIGHDPEAVTDRNR